MRDRSSILANVYHEICSWYNNILRLEKNYIHDHVIEQAYFVHFLLILLKSSKVCFTAMLSNKPGQGNFFQSDYFYTYVFYNFYMHIYDITVTSVLRSGRRHYQKSGTIRGFTLEYPI